jgi:hypothetical protein
VRTSLPAVFLLGPRSSPLTFWKVFWFLPNVKREREIPFWALCFDLASFQGLQQDVWGCAIGPSLCPMWRKWMDSSLDVFAHKGCTPHCLLYHFCRFPSDCVTGCFLSFFLKPTYSGLVPSYQGT